MNHVHDVLGQMSQFNDCFRVFRKSRHYHLPPCPLQPLHHLLLLLYHLHPALRPPHFPPVFPSGIYCAEDRASPLQVSSCQRLPQDLSVQVPSPSNMRSASSPFSAHYPIS